MLNAALDGRLLDVKHLADKLFGFDAPTSCPDVPADVFDPASTWGDKDECWKK